MARPSCSLAVILLWVLFQQARIAMGLAILGALLSSPAEYSPAQGCSKL